MNTERAALRGAKAVEEHKLHELKTEAEAVRLALRDKLGDWIGIEAVEHAQALKLAERLDSLCAQARECQQKIDKFEEALNG